MASEKRRVDEDGVQEHEPAQERKVVKLDLGDLDFQLKRYYSVFFPSKKFFRWLSYGNISKNYYANREFCFTLKDDVYVRYLSFNSDSDLRTELMNKVPHKIDIGAVYNAKPKDQKTMKSGAFQPTEKELVFDIDMTDYDEVRTCCNAANICHKCWKFMTIAIKILDRALREDFGFQHLLWVYSGRRGVHCWVCDERARKLSNEGRVAVAEYLSVVKGGEQQAKKVRFPDKLHPSLIRAHTILARHFEEVVLKDQNIIAHDMSKILDAISDAGLRDTLKSKWTQSQASSETRWKDFRIALSGILQKFPSHTLKNCEQELMFQLCYPRLDVKVSQQINHLLKSPFCIHPKTGRVCVPIDPAKADKFDPLAVPTVMQLFDELDSYSASSHMAVDEDHGDDAMETSDGQLKLADYKKTSLVSYMEVFNSFLQRLEDSHRKRKQQDGSMTF